MASVTISISPDRTVDFLGWDMGGKCSLVAITKKQVAVKVNGGTHWSARGETRYYPTRIKVLDILEERGRQAGKYLMFVDDTNLDIPVRVDENDVFLKTHMKYMFGEENG